MNAFITGVAFVWWWHASGKVLCTLQHLTVLPGASLRRALCRDAALHVMKSFGDDELRAAPPAVHFPFPGADAAYALVSSR